MTEPTRGPDEETSERTVDSFPRTSPPPPPQPYPQIQPPQSQYSGWTPPPGSMKSAYPQSNQWHPPGQSYLPGYWQAQQPYGTSTLVTIAGVVMLILGGLFTLGGLGFVMVAAAGSEVISELDPTWQDADAAAILAVMALFILAVGVIEMVTSVGLFLHKEWARWTGIVISVIGILLGLFMVVVAYEPPADSGFAGFALVWTAAHAFTAAALGAGRIHFERQAPPPYPYPR